MLAVSQRMRPLPALVPRRAGKGQQLEWMIVAAQNSSRNAGNRQEPQTQL
jgi:hypothetical protein